jgi:amino acid permease
MQAQKHQQHIGVKQLILVAILFMMIGTAMELYLLDHYEGTLQLIPLLCIGATLLVMLLLFVRKTGLLMGIFQILLGLTALSGVYGVFLHLRANYEFEQEMKPTAEPWDVFVESLAGALPSLAPASMIVLALIGYSYLLLLKREQ